MNQKNAYIGELDYLSHTNMVAFPYGINE